MRGNVLIVLVLYNTTHIDIIVRVIINTIVT